MPRGVPNKPKAPVEVSATSTLAEEAIVEQLDDPEVVAVDEDRDAFKAEREHEAHEAGIEAAYQEPSPIVAPLPQVRVVHKECEGLGCGDCRHGVILVDG